MALLRHFIITILLTLCFTATAHVQNSPRVFNVKSYGAVGNGSTNDRTAIFNANTAAAVGGGVVYFPSPGSYRVNSALTFSTNVVTKFDPGALLTIPTGVIVNHNGTIDAAPNRKIFNLAGTGRITFGGVDCTVSCSQTTTSQPTIGAAMLPAYYPQWWGVTGDWNGSTGTDDTTALQQMLNVIPGYSQIFFTPNLKMAISSTLNFYNRKGVLWRSAGQTGDGHDTIVDDVATFYWLGADGGTMIDLGGMRDSYFEGFTLIGNRGATSANGADRGIWIEQVNNSGGGISSNNTFQNIFIYSRSLRAGWVGVQIGDAAGSNNEFMRFIHCSFAGSTSDNPAGGTPPTGTNIYILQPNTKHITLQDCVVKNANIGIRVAAGSYIGSRNAIAYSNIGYQLETWTDKIVIDSDDSEGLTQLLNVVTASTPAVSIRNGRYDRTSAFAGLVGTASKPFIDTRSGNTALEVSNNNFGFWFHTSSSTWWTDDRWLIRGSDTGYVIWNHNTFNAFDQNLLQENWVTLNLCTVDGQVIGSSTNSALAGLFGLQSSGLSRRLVELQAGASTSLPVYGLNVCATGNPCLVDGALEFGGLGKPSAPYVRVIGTPGSTAYILSVMALDSLGRRTQRSSPTNTTTANATLDGTNYLSISWLASPGAASYSIIQTDPSNAAQYRVIASGIASANYDLQSNPVGAFNYVLPTYNETSQLIGRAQTVWPIEVTFTANDTSPSVGIGSDFVTANSGATSVTTFDDPVVGQIIRVRANDANTTFVNGATLITGTGGNVVAVNGKVYQFIYRGTAWRLI